VVEATAESDTPMSTAWDSLGWPADTVEGTKGSASAISVTSRSSVDEGRVAGSWRWKENKGGRETESEMKRERDEDKRDR
jgi:hypothetical protein